MSRVSAVSLVGIFASIGASSLSGRLIVGTGDDAATHMVVECIQDTVTIVDQSGNERPAGIGSRVYPGEKVKTGNGGAATFRLADGSHICLGPKAEMQVDKWILTPPAKGSWLARVFSLIGAAIESTGLTTPRRYSRTGNIAVGIRGSEYMISDTGPGAGAIMELSVVSGSAEVDAINYLSLPDRYFSNPANKSYETMLDDVVLSETTDSISYLDLVGIGAAVEVPAGYWTQMVGSTAPAAPLAGMAPSHQGLTCCVPEPSSGALLLCGIGIGWMVKRQRSRRSSLC